MMLKVRGVMVSVQMARRSSSGRAEKEARGDTEGFRGFMVGVLA
jgi:hypothetical protein